MEPYLFTNWTPVQYGNQQLLTTLPLESLIADAQFLNPAELEAEFPGLLVGNVQTNFFTVQISTNIEFIPTNQTVLPVFSGSVPGGLPIATHATNIYYFTNQPGPTVINYDRTQPFATISTLDLGAFVDASVHQPAGGIGGIVSRFGGLAGDHFAIVCPGHSIMFPT